MSGCRLSEHRKPALDLETLQLFRSGLHRPLVLSSSVRIVARRVWKNRRARLLIVRLTLSLLLVALDLKALQFR